MIAHPFMLAALAVTATVTQEPAQRPLAPGDTVVCHVRPDSAPGRSASACIVQPPEIVKQGAPEYPRQLREAGIEGDVVVRMIVDTLGHPERESIAIVKAAHPDFEPAVRAWVKSVEFRPARLSGRAVRVLVNVPLRFALRANAGTETSEDLLAAARAQLTARHLDRAAVLFRRVAEAPVWRVPNRVQAWVLLGVTDYYRSGDSAAADAFRHALTLDPGFEVAALDQFDPAIAQILANERAALPSRAQPPPTEAAPLYECLSKCPEGVRPPRFISFPQIMFTAEPSAGGPTGRMHTYLSLQAVIGADGIVEAETILMLGGTAPSTEGAVRQGLVRARFAPARADGAPVRTRVSLRFDFEAEGTNGLSYTYRVEAR